jgi:hypothetical protein
MDLGCGVFGEAAGVQAVDCSGPAASSMDSLLFMFIPNGPERSYWEGEAI